jgi:hypothetical protein
MGIDNKNENIIDEFDILSAIWIMSCNDDNEIITYEGIKYRLNLQPAFDLKSLIKGRAELFRRGINSNSLEQWKNDLLSRSPERLPSWIRVIEDNVKRLEIINSLSPDDVFRSQFRAARGSPKTDINVIQWGLDHISRIRSAKNESREQKFRKITNLVIPTISLLITLVTVICSAYFQYSNILTQRELKRNEITLRPRNESYSRFMNYLLSSFKSADNRDKNTLSTNLDNVESAYFALEPFLKNDIKDSLWAQYQQFNVMCMQLVLEPIDSKKNDDFLKSYNWYKSYFHDNLYSALFGTIKIR